MSSTISAARQALFALLTAAAADNTNPLYGVQIAWGDPLAAEEQEVVSMRGLRPPNDEEQVLLGPTQPQDETYAIGVTVKAHDPAGEAATVDARGFALADGVREAVYADRTFGGVLAFGARVVSQISADAAQPAEEGGFVIFVDLAVLCHGRTT